MIDETYFILRCNRCHHEHFFMSEKNYNDGLGTQMEKKLCERCSGEIMFVKSSLAKEEIMGTLCPCPFCVNERKAHDRIIANLAKTTCLHENMRRGKDGSFICTECGAKVI